MEINPTQATNPAGAPLTNAAAGGDMDKTAFLKLLVAQMRHQDPLEPMSNTEFVAQLAQFSSVEQLVSVNEGINLLQYQQMGAANAQASSFIGKEVEVRSDQLQVDDGNSPVTVGFKLQQAAEIVKVNFRDASGAIVRTIEMGPQADGEISLEWDTRDDNGNYVVPGSFRVDVVAEDVNGNSVSWEARVRGLVEGVGYSSGYPELVIGSIKATLNDILGVYPSDAAEVQGDMNP